MIIAVCVVSLLLLASAAGNVALVRMLLVQSSVHVTEQTAPAVPVTVPSSPYEDPAVKEAMIAALGKTAVEERDGSPPLPLGI